MNKPLRVLLLLPLIGLLLPLLAACNTVGCTDNRSSLLLAGFFSSSTGKAISVKGVEVGGVGAPADSLLIDGSASEVYLPLRHTATETSFYFHYTDNGLDYLELNDTISLTYTATPYFASEECGAVYQYTIHTLSYTTHLVDSVALLDSIINNANLQKMQIFFLTE